MNKPALLPALAASIFALTQLAGCNSKPETASAAVEATAGGATARVDASGAATASLPDAGARTGAAEAPAAAAIGASGVEARAGDVSVKLPN
jgi:hypothetical protein